MLKQRTEKKTVAQKPIQIQVPGTMTYILDPSQAAAFTPAPAAKAAAPHKARPAASGSKAKPKKKAEGAKKDKTPRKVANKAKGTAKKQAKKKKP